MLSAIPPRGNGRRSTRHRDRPSKAASRRYSAATRHCGPTFQPLDSSVYTMKVKTTLWPVIVALLWAARAVAGQQAPAQPAPAQPAPAQQAHIPIPRIEVAPRLDDYIDGRPAGVEVSGFRQRDPGDLVPVSQPTTAYLAYDASTLYVAFVCKAADPSSIRARMAKRESIFED